jgi:hypothetical protein
VDGERGKGRKKTWEENARTRGQQRGEPGTGGRRALIATANAPLPAKKADGLSWPGCERDWESFQAVEGEGVTECVDDARLLESLQACGRNLANE